MGFKGKASSSGGNGFSVAPAGSHPAVCVAMIELGTHQGSFGDQEKQSAKVFVCWELTSEQMAGSTMNHVVGRMFTLSFHEKAALRIILEKWRGKVYREGEDMDYSVILGKPCLVNVVQKQSGGQTFSNVDSISAVPKGMTVPPAKHKTFLWTFEGKQPLPEMDWLPRVFGKTVKDKIESSPEWDGGASDHGNGHAGSRKPETPPDGYDQEGAEAESQEIPF